LAAWWVADVALQLSVCIFAESEFNASAKAAKDSTRRSTVHVEMWQAMLSSAATGANTSVLIKIEEELVRGKLTNNICKRWGKAVH
jgi:hypothetical protein